MIRPIKDIIAIAPTTYNTIVDTTLTPIINNVRNKIIETTPIAINIFFNACISDVFHNKQ